MNSQGAVGHILTRSGWTNRHSVTSLNHQDTEATRQTDPLMSGERWHQRATAQILSPGGAPAETRTDGSFRGLLEAEYARALSEKENSRDHHLEGAPHVCGSALQNPHEGLTLKSQENSIPCSGQGKNNQLKYTQVLSITKAHSLDLS